MSIGQVPLPRAPLVTGFTKKLSREIIRNVDWAEIIIIIIII